jgi:hypothetical protein
LEPQSRFHALLKIATVSPSEPRIMSEFIEWFHREIADCKRWPSIHGVLRQQR